MSMVNLVIARSISTTSCHYGKRNFRKFELINKRGSKLFKKRQAENPDPLYPIDKRGVRDTGYKIGNTFIEIPEMIPELIVPDLEGFNLKPYVSYRSLNVAQSEFTPQELFDAVYAPKIKDDYEKGLLDTDGNPLNPSLAEKQTPEEARALASKPGSDIFTTQPEPLGTFFPENLR